MPTERWRNRSLQARLLIGSSALLIVLGVVLQYSALQRMASEYQRDIALEAESTANFLAKSLQPLSIRGDDAAIEAVLRTQATRRRIQEIVWRSATGHAVHINPWLRQPAPPAWFRALGDLHAPPIARVLLMDGRPLGTISIRLNAVTWENRLWSNFVRQALYQTLEIGLLLVLIIFIVDYYLKPLRELIHAAHRYRAGDRSARGALPPNTAPEIREVITAVNQAADSIQTLVDSLHTSEEKFRALVETTQDWFWEIDAEGRYVYSSPRVVEVLGYRPEEMLGKRPRDFIPPDEGERVGQAFQDLTARRLPLTLLERVKLHKEGRRVILETSAIPIFDTQGNYAGYRGVCRDITARRHTEQISLQLGRILDDALEEIYVFDAETLRFVLVNRGARANLGYTDEELARLTPLDLKPLLATPEDFEALIAPLRRGELESIHFETIHQRKDGSNYPVEVRLQLSQAVTRPAFFAIAQDITVRQAAERELVRSRDALREFSYHLQQARELEKAKIAREVHDELGGVLTAIKMDAYWLSSKLSSEQAALQQKAQSLLALIDIAVRSTRRIVTELRPTILDDLGVVAAMQWQAREFELRTGIVCTLHFPPDEPMLDEARAIVLFRILQEALTNIAKHAQAEEVRVRYESGHEAVTLKIQDDGCGISQQGMSDSTGHGIRGMSERARHLNGEVWVEPGVSKGTVVCVRLPHAPVSDKLNA